MDSVYKYGVGVLVDGFKRNHTLKVKLNNDVYEYNYTDFTKADGKEGVRFYGQRLSEIDIDKVSIYADVLLKNHTQYNGIECVFNKDECHYMSYNHFIEGGYSIVYNYVLKTKYESSKSRLTVICDNKKTNEGICKLYKSVNDVNPLVINFINEDENITFNNISDDYSMLEIAYSDGIILKSRLSLSSSYDWKDADFLVEY